MPITVLSNVRILLVIFSRLMALFGAKFDILKPR